MIELKVFREQIAAFARSALKRYSLLKILPRHRRVIETTLIEFKRLSPERDFVLLSNCEAKVLTIALLHQWTAHTAKGDYLVAKRGCAELLLGLGHELATKKELSKAPLTKNRKKKELKRGNGNAVHAQGDGTPVGRPELRKLRKQGTGTRQGA